MVFQEGLLRMEWPSGPPSLSNPEPLVMGDRACLPDVSDGVIRRSNTVPSFPFFLQMGPFLKAKDIPAETTVEESTSEVPASSEGPEPVLQSVAARLRMWWKGSVQPGNGELVEPPLIPPVRLPRGTFVVPLGFRLPS